ncbi:hypothetical protein FGO68_gene5504 [Halteria grandinella]|uniref:HD domain-containing protein n=1 Tax=Halteria grandinella TaxID=5974 RepID=A0A8J8NPB2_HALGN|nr:hypothetical protein FGO68_gene5504 [Halteria grandinella]
MKVIVISLNLCNLINTSILYIMGNKQTSLTEKGTEAEDLCRMNAFGPDRPSNNLPSKNHTSEMEPKSSGADEFDDFGPDFDECFPLLFQALVDFDLILPLKETKSYCDDKSQDIRLRKKRLYQFMGSVKQNLLPRINDEIEALLPEWKSLRKIDEEHVCVHTLGVVYCVMQDPEFRKLNRREQNILKWSALLHDIRKQGPPVFEGKDHMHPFKGAMSVLEIFLRFKTFQIQSEDQLEALANVKKYMDLSKQPVPTSWSKHFKKGVKYCTEMHSHKYLSDVFSNLEKIVPRSSFTHLVFRLVLFHQSLCGCDDYPNMINLEPHERISYCQDTDGAFYKLMRVLMYNDAHSYIFVMDEHGNREVFRRQIFGHVEEYCMESL